MLTHSSFDQMRARQKAYDAEAAKLVVLARSYLTDGEDASELRGYLDRSCDLEDPNERKDAIGEALEAVELCIVDEVACLPSYCSLKSFEKVNAESADIIAMVRALAPGGSVTIGGGASPATTITATGSQCIRCAGRGYVLAALGRRSCGHAACSARSAK